MIHQAVKPNGTISDGRGEVLALQPQFYEKELYIVGSNDDWDYRRHL